MFSKILTPADSLGLAASTMVGAAEHADPKQTILLQILALVLPKIPSIIRAIKMRVQRKK